MVDVGPPQADIEVAQFFGTTVVDNTGRYLIALTTTLASGPASWTDEPPELSITRLTSTTRTTRTTTGR
jgi:hypothetical protein